MKKKEMFSEKRQLSWSFVLRKVGAWTPEEGSGSLPSHCWWRAFAGSKSSPASSLTMSKSRCEASASNHSGSSEGPVSQVQKQQKRRVAQGGLH